MTKKYRSIAFQNAIKMGFIVILVIGAIVLILWPRIFPEMKLTADFRPHQIIAGVGSLLWAFFVHRNKSLGINQE